MKSLTFPLILGILTLFLLKPALKSVKHFYIGKKGSRKEYHQDVDLEKGEHHQIQDVITLNQLKLLFNDNVTFTFCTQSRITTYNY